VTIGADGRLGRAGVLAAGRGDRLTFVSRTLKPLVRVGGQTLIERVLLSLAEAGPVEVVIIVNEASVEVKDHVTSSRKWPFAVRWIVETTPSSMHSFLRLVETLAEDGDGGPFLISTVDTIAAPGAFGAFAAASRELDADVTLAVTPPIDDDKPLLVRLGPDGATVEAIGETVRLTAAGRAGRDDLQEETRGGRIWATAGYYAIRSSVLREADEARRDGVSALRLFLERLLVRGYRLQAVPVAAGIDVDRPADVRAAETFLKQVRA
jgi:NDP-sugar pyrophosphorylase family protein